MDISGGLTPPEGLVKDDKTSILHDPGALFIVIYCIFVLLCVTFFIICLIKSKNKKKKTTKPNCPICGEATEEYCGNPRQDKLCRVHAAMLRDNQIELCKYCGSWYKTDTGCKCQKFD